jgi:hypothetical protein
MAAINVKSENRVSMPYGINGGSMAAALKMA